MSGHRVIAVGAGSTDRAAIRAFEAGGSYHRSLMMTNFVGLDVSQQPLWWIVDQLDECGAIRETAPIWQSSASIGRQITVHGRYMTLQMAEVAVPRDWGVTRTGHYRGRV